MEKIKIYALGLLFLTLISSCTLSMPGFVTANKIGSKIGVAERTIFLGLAFGETDLSIVTAAKNGSIKKVATVDYSITGGFFSKTYRTTVTGE